MSKSTLLIIFLVVQAYACPPGIADTSVYNLPDAQIMCGKYGWACPKFKAQVNIQGSGKITPTTIVRYKKFNKPESLNGCPTTRGAWGKCQIPYITVAADRRHYKMGDIIRMDSLKGRVMKLRNGETLVHPGFLIVEDVGGAIDGKGRFDIFTEQDLNDPNNTIGYKGAEQDLLLVDPDKCPKTKAFSKITKKGSPVAYESALAAIEKAAGRDIDDFPAPVKTKKKKSKALGGGSV